MDQEIKQKWIEALRSGEYEQGYGQLKTTGGQFCCLGVLCEIHPDVEFHWVDDRWVAVYGSVTNAGTLPESLARHMDLPSGAVEVPIHYAQELLPPFVVEEEFSGEGQKVFLTNLNDKGVSFSKIADVIEKEF